jgi:hypothetical protein
VIVQIVLLGCILKRGISSEYCVLVQTVLLDCVIKGEDLFIIWCVREALKKWKIFCNFTKLDGGAKLFPFFSRKI